MVRFTKAADSNIQSARVGRGKFLLGDNLDQLLTEAGVKREPMVDEKLRFVRRRHSNGGFYLLVNTNSESFDGWVGLQGNPKSVAIFDPMFEKKGLAAIQASANGDCEIYLQLAPGESCILKTFETAITGPLYNYVKTIGNPQEIKGTWSVSFIEGGPQLPADIRAETLVSWTDFGGQAVKNISGTARYTISIRRPEGRADGWLLDLGRVCESARVKLNGEELGTLICPPFKVMIPANRMEKENILEIEVSNLMANRIADMDRRGVKWKKFYNINFPPRRRENRGPDGLFDASGWQTKDSGLLGPVKLVPVELMTFTK